MAGLYHAVGSPDGRSDRGADGPTRQGPRVVPPSYIGGDLIEFYEALGRIIDGLRDGLPDDVLLDAFYTARENEGTMRWGRSVSWLQTQVRRCHGSEPPSPVPEYITQYLERALRAVATARPSDSHGPKSV